MDLSKKISYDTTNDQDCLATLNRVCNAPPPPPPPALAPGSQGLGTEEEEVSLRIEKVINKKSVSIVNPAPILPAHCT